MCTDEENEDDVDGAVDDGDRGDHSGHGDDGDHVDHGDDAHRVPQPHVRLDGRQSSSSGCAKHLVVIFIFMFLC